MAWCLAGNFLQTVLLLPIPLLQCWVIDRLLTFTRQGPAGPEDRAQMLSVITLSLAGTIACFALRTLVAWKCSAAMSRVSLEVVRTLTDLLHRKLQRLPVSYYDRAQTGRLMARITSDVGTLLIFLNSASIGLICDLILALGIAGVLLWIEWRLALVSFLVMPLYLLNYHVFAARTHDLCARAQKQVAAIYALLSEKISAVRVVRAFTNEESEIADFNDCLDIFRDLSWDRLRTGAWQGAAAVLISGLGTVVVLALGAWMVGQEQLGIGAIVAFYALLTQLYNPMVRLTQFQGTMAATGVALERMREVLEEPELMSDLPDAIPVVRPRGEIALENVSFAYHPAGPRVLEEIDLTVKPAMKVGILGASGAGKSTLLALIPRIYEVPPGAGRILLDGYDVRKLRLADLRRAVVLVPQQAQLFEGTILSNLLYARPKAPTPLVQRVLEVTELADMVADLPQGWDTPVGERGVTLSGGQRQRLALARALITEPSVLLLDDCTSALDAETEARIGAALADFLPGRTCFWVSHKVSSVRHADRIIVLENGRIAEQGTHQELLTRGGIYAGTASLQIRPL
jgi:ABC-type multidrug transport system fused ATPase/permease subunit